MHHCNPCQVLHKDERFVLLFRREWYIRRLNLVAKSPFWTQEKPVKNSKQLLYGFFYEVTKDLLLGVGKGFDI
jgi:hypothetical protein